jgi:hypothetical protein
MVRREIDHSGSITFGTKTITGWRIGTLLLGRVCFGRINKHLDLVLTLKVGILINI